MSKIITFCTRIEKYYYGFFKFSKSSHLISMLDHHCSSFSSLITHHQRSRKYNYILIQFDINYSQIVFPPDCEKLSLETGGKNYYDFAETKTLQFNSFNTKKKINIIKVYLVSTQFYRTSVRLQPQIVNSQDDRLRLFLHIAKAQIWKTKTYVDSPLTH